MPSSASRGRWTQRVLSLVALVASVEGALNGWLISRLHEGAVTTTAVGTYLRLSLLLNVLVVLATGLSALFFLRWLHLAVRTAKMLGLEPGTTPGWAVGWWFVPLANLYDPYLVVRGLWLCLGGSPKAGASVSTWWTAWVLSVVAWCVQVYLLGTLAMDPFQFTPALLAGFVTGVLITLGALLCMRVIGQVQTLIDECMDEVAEAA
ncbi:DUF4328 domain-containing protein [Hyalangium rubrum]|uniref:DUF4328 domain-containing protein n=1 Tax=Hyalangium rubrum TaxID=3103134 RepID=A0ABU5HDK6_9BACT|nr:DUF4328 domain-containing protein [Hyalangium sp. s54d21]MDY7231561.1 DUF4328 domain-containing protein [Hyalangium sp. s54d21]